jgi:hypothetical protein
MVHVTCAEFHDMIDPEDNESVQVGICPGVTVAEA